jgi:hypothetical protein
MIIMNSQFFLNLVQSLLSNCEFMIKIHQSITMSNGILKFHYEFMILAQSCPILSYLVPNICYYADDLKIFHEISSKLDADFLQENLDKLKITCDDNQLHLNVIKCHILTFSRTSTTHEFFNKKGSGTLERLKIVSDLGVLLDEKLNFKPQCDKVISGIATGLLGFINPLTPTGN